MYRNWGMPLGRFRDGSIATASMCFKMSWGSKNGGGGGGVGGAHEYRARLWNLTTLMHE
jgi:hypothetical protein